MKEAETRSERRSRWRELKRRELLSVAVELIRREGLEPLTMEAVAEAAGVAKGTVYLYFESKSGLVASAVETILEPLVVEVCRLLESDDAPEEKLRAMAAANLTFFDRHRSLFRVFIHGRYAPRTQTERFQANHYRKVLASTAGVIRQGISSGRFRRADPEITAAIWVEALTVVLIRRLQAADPGTAKEAADSLQELFFHGLLQSSAG